MTEGVSTGFGGVRGDGVPSARLVELAYELLDAGTDTLELLERRTEVAGASTGPMTFEWALHADYLRALQRRGREILAAEIVGARQRIPC